MTRRQFDIDESRRAIFTRDGWACQHCGAPATEIAHRIGQGHAPAVRLAWSLLFREEKPLEWIRANVMHHPLNVAASCRKCNSYFNKGFKPVFVKELLEEIRENLKNKGVLQ